MKPELLPHDWKKVMKGAENLGRTIESLISKSKDRLSEYYDSKLKEKSSSPKYFWSLWYSKQTDSKSRSHSKSLERETPAIDLMGSVTPQFLRSQASSKNINQITMQDYIQTRELLDAAMSELEWKEVLV